MQKQGGNTAAEKMKSLAIFSDVCLMTTATLMKWTQTEKPGWVKVKVADYDEFIVIKGLYEEAKDAFRK